MSKANVYQQRPEPGVHAESPLHHAELHKLAGKTAAKAGIVLREKKLLGHLVLRGDAADPAFAAAVHQALGRVLPVGLTLGASGAPSMLWLAPAAWLLLVPGG
ncbi:sarcosine oxidase subunit gamma, partial [Pseudomonas aeruginosa]